MPIRALTTELQKTAIEQLNEVPERVQDDIEALRAWLKLQPHLIARTDEQFLVTYLRGCKYSLELAKSKIDKFYTFRTKYPEIFIGHNINLDALLEIFRQGASIYLPTPLHETGARLAIFRMGKVDINKYTFEDINRAGQLAQLITMLEDDYATVNGLIQILDLENVNASVFLQMSPSLMKKITTFNKEAMPFRPKAIHLINVPMGFDKIFNMFKSKMSEKQQKRTYMHGNDWNALYEVVPRKYFPIEYGGENGSIPEIIKNWEQRILGYRDYFAEENNYRTNESLRPGKPFDFEGAFGLEGSFKKLNVD